MRISSLIAAVLLTGCGRAEDQAPGASQQDSTSAPETEKIACSRGQAPLRQSCTLETSPDGSVLTIRHEDGGFRRLSITSEGIAAADGAEPARATPLTSGEIEVTISEDRYRLPPTP